MSIPVARQGIVLGGGARTRPDTVTMSVSKDAASLEQVAAPLKTNGYGQYLLQVSHDKVF